MTAQPHEYRTASDTQAPGRMNLVGQQWPAKIQRMIERVLELHHEYTVNGLDDKLTDLILAETALTTEKRRYHNDPARYLAELDAQDEQLDRDVLARPNFM